MMNTASLNDAIEAITVILDTVDRGNPDAIFDALVEVELLSVDAVTAHGVRKLLGQGEPSAQGELLFENAA